MDAGTTNACDNCGASHPPRAEKCAYCGAYFSQPRGDGLDKASRAVRFKCDFVTRPDEMNAKRPTSVLGTPGVTAVRQN